VVHRAILRNTQRYKLPGMNCYRLKPRNLVGLTRVDDDYCATFSSRRIALSGILIFFCSSRGSRLEKRFCEIAEHPVAYEILDGRDDWI
jgi:hypothetical protein